MFLFAIVITSWLDKDRIPFGAKLKLSGDKIETTFAHEQLRITGVFLTPRGAWLVDVVVFSIHPKKGYSDKGC